MLLEFTCPADTSICPATLLNKVELHCEDSPQNYLAARGKLRSCFACQIVVFLPNSPATGQAVILHAAKCWSWSVGLEPTLPAVLACLTLYTGPGSSSPLEPKLPALWSDCK